MHLEMAAHLGTSGTIRRAIVWRGLSQSAGDRVQMLISMTHTQPLKQPRIFEESGRTVPHRPRTNHMAKKALMRGGSVPMKARASFKGNSHPFESLKSAGMQQRPAIDLNITPSGAVKLVTPRAPSS
jgi:hypothetical protein